MPRILMTGASGGIGTRLRKLLPPIYPDLLLSDIRPPKDLGANEQFKAADLSDMAQVEAICEGVDGIIHFGGQGWIRPVYFTLLTTHTVLAIIILPLAIVTLSRALAQKFDRHRRIARWTFPIWLYVSVTGVIVYFLLYRLYPAATVYTKY